MKLIKLIFILVLASLHGCTKKENPTPPLLVCSYDWLTNPFYHTLPEIVDSTGLYNRPAYKLAKYDVSLYLCCKTEYGFEDGWWTLVEIADCNSGIVYYPCRYVGSRLGFEPDKKPELNQLYPEQYPYEYFITATTGNASGFTYQYLNDSTIITSGGGATHAGVPQEVQDFFLMYASLLQNTTLVIKKNRNLLELRTPENVFLRFYK